MESINETANTSIQVISSKIPVLVGHRPQKVLIERADPVRKTLKRNNAVVQAATLPKFSSYNMRSLMPKIKNFATDMLDRICSLSFVSEVWEKQENKSHQLKIEELLEISGLKYISTPRSGSKRGGGAALVADTRVFSLSKLNIQIPKRLEICWGLLRLKEYSGIIRKIIVCSFYCPPKSKKMTDLIEHMTLTLQHLRSVHPKAGVIISGDRNDLSINRLLTIDTSLKQIVFNHTRGVKVLTVVLTDLYNFYQEPNIVSPVMVDIIGKGVPSDHNGVVVSQLIMILLKLEAKKSSDHLDLYLNRASSKLVNN